MASIMDAKRPIHNSPTSLSPYLRLYNVAIFVMLLAHVEYPGISALKLRHETKLLHIILGQCSIFLNTSLFLILLGMKAKMEAVSCTRNVSRSMTSHFP